MLREQMDRIYGTTPLDKIPWNATAPPETLASALKNIMTTQSRVIDLGCGAGNYVIHFSSEGYDVTGVDISENAIRIARRSASAAGARCRFIVADLLGSCNEIDATFDVAYDWELLHHIFPEDRERYIRNVHGLLDGRGRYLSVCFSEDDGSFGGVGKYRKTPLDTVLYFSSEAELESLFDGFFAVENLKTVDIPGKHGLHKAIFALMTKRDPKTGRSAR